MHARDGATELQCVVTDGGYVLYAVQGSWTEGMPTGVVHVRELVAADLAARLRLWRHLLELDLTTQVRARVVAPDDPLLLAALAEPRSATARDRTDAARRCGRDRSRSASPDALDVVSTALGPPGAAPWCPQVF